MTETSNKPQRLSLGARLALTIGSLPTNLGWALSEALIIPYLLEVGCPFYACSWAWILSPILATQFGPILDKTMDSWKDENSCGWRGRKNFIMLLSIISGITMFLIPQSHTIAKFLTYNHTALTVVLVGILFTLMDLSHYLLERPLKALFWDVSWGEDAIFEKIISTYTVMTGICRLTGYSIIGIWLHWDLFGDKLSHIKAIFTIGSILVLISMTISLAFSPNPPEFIGESTLKYGEGLTVVNNIDDDDDLYERDEIIKLLKQNDNNNNISGNNESKINNENKNNNQSIAPMDIIEDNSHNKIGMMYRSSWNTPGFYLFFISQLMGWITLCSVTFFWTSFMGVNIYNGKPDSNSSSHSFKTFERGLIFGVFGLIIMSLFTIFTSSFYDNFINKDFVNIRVLYTFTELSIGVLCVIFFIVSNKWALLVCIGIFGIFSELHLKTCTQLTNSELRKIYVEIQKSSKKSLLKGFVEFGSVIAPVFVAIWGGPIAWFFNEKFKYVFLLPGCVVIILNLIVACMFADILPIKLPNDNN